MHATSSYDCRTCGYKTGTRNNFVRHLRIHDRSYCPSFKCDFCGFKAKDNWHLDKHSLSHFKDTNCRSLNGPLSTFCAMNVAVSLTEFQVSDVCVSIYEMSISKADHVEPVATADQTIDWTRAEDTASKCFGQLGMEDSDWADWVNISDALGLRSCDGFMSWVCYTKEEEREVFRVGIEDNNGTKEKEGLEVSEFIEELYDDVCDAISELGVCSSPDVNNTDNEVASETVEKVIVVEKNSSMLRCDMCEKAFKDKTHLAEHAVRMHSEPKFTRKCVPEDVHTKVVHFKLDTSTHSSSI